MEQPAVGTGSLKPAAGDDSSMELGTCHELLHRLRELEVCGGRQGGAVVLARTLGSQGCPPRACQAGGGWVLQCSSSEQLGKKTLQRGELSYTPSVFPCLFTFMALLTPGKMVVSETTEYNSQVT